MLPKKNRPGRKLVEQIFKSGRTISGERLVLKFIIYPRESLPQISFIVPKNVVKKPTRRNFLRREGYNAVEKYIFKLPGGFCGAFIFKKETLDLENEIKNILNKLR